MTPWLRWNAVPAPAEPAWRWLAQSLGMPALLATPARPRTELTPPKSRLPELARQKLSELLGPRLRLDDEARLAHAATGGTASLLRLRSGDLSQIPDAILCPRNEDEVLALLNICADIGIALGPSNGRHPARATLDLGGMAEIVSLDAMSGIAQVQAGVASADLSRQLAARGMTFEPADFSNLGHWIARGIGTRDVLDVRLATPKGLLSGNLLPGTTARFGIVTAANLRVRTAPASTAHLHVLFPDFASGLAAMRETQRESVARIDMRLSDGDETRFERQLAAVTHPAPLMERVAQMVRDLHHLQESPAALRITFSGSAADVDISRKRFAALGKRLGARTVAGTLVPDYRPALLDRGVTVDRVRASATWSNLPVLYTGLRAALDQAMRRHAPRTGAHGLVLMQITGARHEGADLTCTFLYPRQLNGDVAQARAVRQIALDFLTAQDRKNNTPDRDVRHAIAKLLDPAGVLTAEES